VYALSSDYDTLSDYLAVCISRLMGSVTALSSDYDTSSFTTSYTDYLTVCISRLMGRVNALSSDYVNNLITCHSLKIKHSHSP
jgi:hypothetical protein